ncbi:MAG: asparagine synthase (glutamine-hydrolyzing) [Actinobacteria bacterium]|nr:asparagine synthase (glutamine-hydrolyzing) [Actinomycetota bacterium]
MCGICGEFINKNITSEVDPRVIELMRDAMAHRGPDGSGLWLSDDRKVGFGHRRLAIIDLSPAAAQPMTNEDGTIWITYNGEVYNHVALREELERKRHIYKSHSDTETLIHLYEDKGIDFINEIEGMFAFALWDSKVRTLYLVRDRIGKKPLYWCSVNGRLLFASEIKALLKHQEVSKDINFEGLYQYLTFSVVPAPQTLFSEINKLHAGHYLRVKEDSEPEEIEYWDAIFPIPDDHYKYFDEDFCTDRIWDLYFNAVSKRMMSDVPFGVFLSGGVDSSANVAAMSQLMNQPVRTFSIGIKGQDSYNEFVHARRIADEFKTDHHEIEIDDFDFINFFDEMAYFQDEPLSDPVCVPLYYVSKLARDNGTIVMQVGEGADEIFAGYDEYIRLYNFHENTWKNFSRLPKVLRGLAYMIYPFIDSTKKDYLRRAINGGEFFWGGAVAFGEDEKKNITKFKVDDSWSSSGVVSSYMKRIATLKPTSDYLERMIYLELKVRLPELLLMRMDKMGMATSIEGRAPYLDVDLVRFAMNIPPSVKIKNNIGKYIYKKTLEKVLPKENLYRKKVGFCGSAYNMLTEGIRNHVFGKGSGSKLLLNQYLDMSGYDFSFKNNFKTWNLLTLELWLRGFFK